MAQHGVRPIDRQEKKFGAIADESCPQRAEFANPLDRKLQIDATHRV